MTRREITKIPRPPVLLAGTAYRFSKRVPTLSGKLICNPGNRCGNYTTQIPSKTPFSRLPLGGLGFALTYSAFNRILDFSNGLDFNLGFFFAPTLSPPGFFPLSFPTALNAGHFRYFCFFNFVYETTPDRVHAAYRFFRHLLSG